MRGVQVVAEVFVEGRPVRPQAQCQAGIKMIIGSDAVGQRLRGAQKNIAGDLFNHSVLSVGLGTSVAYLFLAEIDATIALSNLSPKDSE